MKLKVYQPNMEAGPTNPIFGDIDRDSDSVYSNGELPQLFDYDCKAGMYVLVDESE